MLEIIAVGVCREHCLGRFSATSAIAVLLAAKRERIPFLRFKVSGPGLSGEFEPQHAVAAVKTLLVKGSSSHAKL